MSICFRACANFFVVFQTWSHVANRFDLHQPDHMSQWQPDHMSRAHWATRIWSHVADTPDHVDLITCRNQIRSHVATNFLIAPTWSHVADEAEISLSRYLFTVLNYQSTHFVFLSHFNTLALYCIKVLGRTSPLYHFNALKWRTNAL